jgi:hypothetical protein
MKLAHKQFKLKREHITSVSHTEHIVLVVPEEARALFSTFNHKLEGYAHSSLIDHPEFTKMRNRLEKQGYIQIEHGWINGDRALKPFSLNGFKFKKHDKFPCASAMDIWLSVKEKKLTKSKKSV